MTQRIDARRGRQRKGRCEKFVIDIGAFVITIGRRGIVCCMCAGSWDSVRGALLDGDGRAGRCSYARITRVDVMVLRFGGSEGGDRLVAGTSGCD